MGMPCWGLDDLGAEHLCLFLLTAGGAGPKDPGQAGADTVPSASSTAASWNRRTQTGLGWKGPKISSSPLPCHGQGHLPLSQVFSKSHPTKC